jgi:DNA-binding beta-propeller fold protein YncE
MKNARLRRATSAMMLSAAVMFTNLSASAELAVTSHGDPIEPSGAVTELGSSLPLREVVDPSGKWLAILHGGFDVHGVAIVELASGRVVAHAAVREAYAAIDFAADGKSLLVGGSGNELTDLDFDPATGAIGEGRRTNLRGLYQTALRALPGGDVLVFAHVERSVPASTLPANPTGVAAKPDATSEYVLERIGLADPSNTRQNAVIRWTIPLAGVPSALVLSPDKRRAFVTAWHANQLSIIDIEHPAIVANVPTPAHPIAAVLAPQHGLLYVAAAATNTVAVIDTNAARALGTIDVGVLPNIKVGATPNALAITRDEKTLFIANADEDSVIRVNLDGNGGTVTGAISTGVYPTDVLLSDDEKSLYVLDGKGRGVTANPQYDSRFSVDEPTWQHILQASPQTAPVASQDFTGKFGTRYYVASLEPGLLERVNLAAVDETKDLRVLRDRFRQRAADVPHLPPVKHVIYLLKENRTYDQVLGDDPRGNGDPQLAMFGKRVTPNVHALVDQFVLLDNYRLESEVSAPGWEFGFEAYATDVNQRTWPAAYGGQPYPTGIGDDQPAAAAPGGTLWDDALRAGLSVRLYNMPNAWVDPIAAPYAAPLIQDNQDRVFQDADVYKQWLAEFRLYEKSGNLPALEVMPFSGDHTWGTQPYQFTPNAFVAINDYYVGKMVDVISHSKFWKDTVIFTTEDDAQNGPDHVSSERSYLIAAGGYVKRGAVDHSQYSLTGLLRTIEVLLGLNPMNEYDASATVMPIFTSTPNLAPFTSLPNEVSLTDRNPPHAIDAGLSLRMRFDVPDENDPALLNRVLWDYAFAAGDLPRSARFAWTPPPPQKWYDPDDGTGGDEEDIDDEDSDD